MRAVNRLLGTAVAWKDQTLAGLTANMTSLTTLLLPTGGASWFSLTNCEGILATLKPSVPKAKTFCLAF